MALSPLAERVLRVLNAEQGVRTLRQIAYAGALRDIDCRLALRELVGAGLARSPSSDGRYEAVP